MQGDAAGNNPSTARWSQWLLAIAIAIATTRKDSKVRPYMVFLPPTALGRRLSAGPTELPGCQDPGRREVIYHQVLVLLFSNVHLRTIYQPLLLVRQIPSEHGHAPERPIRGAAQENTGGHRGIPNILCCSAFRCTLDIENNPVYLYMVILPPKTHWANQTARTLNVTIYVYLALLSDIFSSCPRSATSIAHAYIPESALSTNRTIGVPLHSSNCK